MYGFGVVFGHDNRQGLDRRHLIPYHPEEEWVLGVPGIDIIFDLISHFIYFLKSALVGKHHKKTSNRVLRIYYDKRVLGPTCLLSEMFFVYAYYSSNAGCVLYVLAAVAVVKTAFHIVHLFEAISGISKIRPEATK